MNSAGIEAPPPQGGMGCFAKGCLILLAFLVLLGAAFVGGTFLAVRVLRTSYFATASAPLPAAPSTEQEQQRAWAKWSEFGRALESDGTARIEMSADELNALVASQPDLRGKAHVTIKNDTARLQISIPLDQVRLLRGRYMNAECTVQSAPDGSPAQAQISGIIVNGKAVGEDVSNWRGPWGFRRFIEQWTDKNEIKTFEIRDGKVIMERRSAN